MVEVYIIMKKSNSAHSSNNIKQYTFLAFTFIFQGNSFSFEICLVLLPYWNLKTKTRIALVLNFKIVIKIFFIIDIVILLQ